MDNIEKIGNVILNYSFYKGRDLYSDGEKIENELLDIVKKYSSEKYNEIIFDKKEWPILYHLSEMRANILEWIPIKKNETVLEIGSGCGAITTILSEKSKKVTCIELSKKRSTINANKNKDKDNIEIFVGNFQDIEITEKYDYITLIGVFEYASSYIDSKNPYKEFLEIIKRYLKPNGKIIIAIENKLGLKYWAGCKEDHTGKYFEGLEGYQNTNTVKTFSKKELKRMLENSGFSNSEFYYPYPDYKLPSVIYSDEYLPKLGELNNNFRNFDEDRIVLFDETEVFDSIIKAGLFTEMSNSFLVIASFFNKDDNKIIYSKYSNSRDDMFKIRTSITSNKINDRKKVEKVALNEEAYEHLEKISNNYNLLKEKYDTSAFKLIECRKNKKNIEFDFVDGKTLVEVLNEEILRNGIEAFLNKIIKIKEKIYEIGKNEKFLITENFIKIFGNVEFDSEMNGISPANIDFIGSNIIIDKYDNDKYNVIDYEWVFDFSVPINYIIYRILLYYRNENTNKKLFNLEEVLKKLSIFEKEQKQYENMDKEFTKYILNNEYFLHELYSKFEVKNIYIGDLLRLKEEIELKEKIQIFENIGNGYNELDSYTIKKEMDEKGNLNINIFINEDIQSLRIDPTEEKCIIIIKDYNEGIKIDVNGKQLFKNIFLFEDGDPQLHIQKIPDKLERINVRLEILKEESIIRNILKEFNQKEKEVNEKNQEIEAKNENIRQLSLELENERNNIQNILNSRSFKLIRSVKKILFWRK